MNRAIEVLPRQLNRLHVPVEGQTRSEMTPAAVTSQRTFNSLASPLMTPKERQSYSLQRAIRCADARSPASCFERDVSETLGHILGNRSGGIYIPPEILFGVDNQLERALPGARTMQVTSPGAGGFLAGADVLPLVTFMYPRSAALQLGAQLIPSLFGASGGAPSLTGDVSLPVETASDEAEWLAEGQSASDDDHDSQFGQAVAVPHRLYAERTVTSQWLAQTAGGEFYLRKILMGAYGAAIDRGILAGNGGAQPTGVLIGEGVTDVAHGTDGGAPTRAKLTEAEGNVIKANSTLATAGYVLSPNVRAKLKNTVAASGNQHLLETVNGQDYVNGVRAIATKYLPDDGTKGSGQNLGSLVFGDWQYQLVAIWGAMEILSDRYTLAANGKTVISATGFMDTLRPLPAMFSRSRDVVTT